MTFDSVVRCLLAVILLVLIFRGLPEAYRTMSAECDAHGWDFKKILVIIVI